MKTKPTRKIQLVKSCDKYGCGIACLAMIEELSYEEVVGDFEQDFDEGAVSESQLIQWLGDKGRAVIRKRLVTYNTRDDGREEILKPFAPVHMLIVQNYVDCKNTHAVVMDSVGNIYCPNGASEESIKESYMILSNYGIY